MNSEYPDVDQDLYSRQIYVLGVDAMKKLSTSKVLVSGLNPIGVELVKNIVLSGVSKVTLHDQKNLSWADFSGNFFAKESSIGKNRAESVLNDIQKLNENCEISVSKEDLSSIDFSDYSCVVFTDIDPVIPKISEKLHSMHIPQIIISSSGLAARVFVDFGDRFVVEDRDGEAPKHLVFENFEIDNNTIVFECTEKHGLETSDRLKFSYFCGSPFWSNLNDTIQKITVLNPTKFSIEIPGSASDEEKTLNRIGFADQVKTPIEISHKPYSVAIEEKKIEAFEFAEYDRKLEIFDAFSQLYSQSPADNKMVKHLRDLKDYFISPICAAVSGICSQEVVKSLTQKYVPVNQFLIFDYTDLYVGSDDDTQDENLSLRKVLGDNFVKNIESKKFFVAGAGALGCEWLKQLALLGATHVTVTDDDNIENSNLSRQFLFRAESVGKSKSKTAVDAIKAMRPKTEYKAMTTRLQACTENVFDTEFWSTTDVFVNSLDNIPTRKYVDNKCVVFNKPLFESGTLGVKANSQVVIPQLTESYSATEDPQDDSIPQCTLHNFPSTTNHVVMWAKDAFSGYFSFDDGFLSKLSEIPEASQRESLQKLILNTKFAPSSFQDCLNRGLRLFNENFKDRINKITSEFPPDSLDNNGLPFWSGSKRCPTALSFDKNDEEMFDFVYYSAKIFADMFHITSVPKDEARTLDIKPESITLSDDIDELNSQIPKDYKKYESIFFEKDDDHNGHIAWITAASNLRAKNYYIPPSDFSSVKQIAGKIVPAMITTTATIVGFIGIELMKYISGCKKIEDYRNTFINLALPLFVSSEPFAPQKTRVSESRDLYFTEWDTFVIDGKKGNATLQEIFDQIRVKYEFANIEIMTCGAKSWYMCFQPSHAQRLNKTLSELHREINGEEIGDSVELAIAAVDEEDEDITLPNILVLM